MMRLCRHLDQTPRLKSRSILGAMPHPATPHQRPTNHNRSKTSLQGSGARSRKNGVHRHSPPERVDSQNNVLKKSQEASVSNNWDLNIPVPKLTLRRASCVVAILSLLCYGNSLHGDFVFDDMEAVLSNKDVKPETPIAELFYDDFWGERLTKNHSHKSYRPLTVLTFRFNYLLSGGFQPFGFHLTNVILHSVISILSLVIFSILFADQPAQDDDVDDEDNVGWQRGFSSPRASLLCALFFTAHPIHTESVAGVVGRADLLCALFFFQSFYFYVSALKKGGCGHSMLRLFFCLLCCMASMLCKEQGITVISVCIIYDVIINCKVDILQVFQYYLSRHRNQTKEGDSVDPRWLPSLATRLCIMGTCGVGLLVGRLFIMGSGPPPFQHFDNPASFAEGVITRMVNYNFIYSINVWLLMVPQWLCFDWSMGCVSLIESANDVRVFVPIALWVFLGFLICKCFMDPPSQRRRVLTMALALLIIPFLPASNLFFRVGFVIAERVLYLPSLGFCMLLTLMVNRISHMPGGRTVMKCVMVGVLVYYVSRCISRNKDWSTEERLYKAGLDVCPLNAKVHYNIGKNAADRGSIDEAILYYRQALSLNPVYDQAMNNLANILKDQGHLEEAEELLQHAVRIRPQFAAAWMNLGIVQAATKKFSQAEQSYQTALFHRHRYADCYFNLGNMYVELGRHDDALLAWYNATALQPDHTSSWANIATLHDRAGQHETAILVAKEAMKHVPDEPSIYYGLGNVLGKEGRYEEAEAMFLKAIHLNPRLANYHGNLGVLYHRWGKYSKAQQHYQAALEMDPKSRNAKDNLKKLQQTMTRQGKIQTQTGPK